VIEGRRVLTISNNQDWFAYEVVTGLRNAEIETGNLVYDLSYEDELYWLDESELDGGGYGNSISYAQFMLNDESLIVRWESSFIAHYFGGFDIWSLYAPEPFRTRFDDVYEFGEGYMDLVFLAPDGEVLGIDDNEIMSAEGTIPLEYVATASGYSFVGNSVGNASYVAGSYKHGIESGNLEAWQAMTGIWNIETGEQIMLIPDTGRLIFSPDNSKIAIDRAIYDVATGERLALPKSDVYHVLSRGNRLLFQSIDNTVRLLDASSLTEIATLPMSRKEMRWYSLYGETLLLKSKDRRRMVSVSLITGETLAIFEREDPILEGVDFSSDERYLLTSTYGAERNILLWDAETGEQINLPEYEIIDSYFTERDEIIVWHPESGSLVFYDVATQEPAKSFFVATGDVESPERVEIYAEEYLVIVSADTIRIYDLESAEQLLTLDTDAYIYELDFQPENQYLAYQTSEWDIEVISLPDGNHVATLEMYQNTNLVGFRSESTIFMANDYGFIGYYDIETGELVEPPPPPPRDPFPIVETDSLRFFRSDTLIRIEDIEGNVLTQIEMGQPYSLTLSNDETRLFVDYPDGTVGIWGVEGE
jgi:WD40 repeat protein